MKHTTNIFLHNLEICMAIKNRILKSLSAAENNNENLLFTEALNNLNVAQNLCQTGLTAENYKPYEEIYDGLVLAVKNLINVGNVPELINLFNELLTYLKNLTQNEQNFKREIVFLPVQAAMWDSLENVWKEANEDKEHIITYVIPLPYVNLIYDKKKKTYIPDKWNWEKNKFPTYVPTIFFNDIDLKEMHPDVIFINNPYDDRNHITRIDNRFYSTLLKDYTDRLIYIPYFIAEEPIEEKYMEEFVLQPGVLNADLTITQSEHIREVYINILSRKNPNDRSMWEKRIIALGSPKIDKIKSLKKEDYELPKKWQKIIKGKKVILYLTSFSPQITNADKMIQKMRYVFNIFKKRRDVALWWRPHPLLKQSLKSKRPDLEKDYLKLEKEYVKDGFGIYDDTGELERAICYSDAYYGDNSSVLTLYKYTEKPVMIENFDICGD